MDCQVKSGNDAYRLAGRFGLRGRVEILKRVSRILERSNRVRFDAATNASADLSFLSVGNFLFMSV